ncbi:MAG TPA: hypothetical protein VGL34_28200, partial [Steroidobacteraceae bacterium]
GRGERWTRQHYKTNDAARVRRSRVVLTPRCWRQVGDDAWSIFGITLATVTTKPVTGESTK